MVCPSQLVDRTALPQLALSLIEGVEDQDAVARAERRRGVAIEPESAIEDCVGDLVEGLAVVGCLTAEQDHRVVGSAADLHRHHPGRLVNPVRPIPHRTEGRPARNRCFTRHAGVTVRVGKSRRAMREPDVSGPEEEGLRSHPRPGRHQPNAWHRGLRGLPRLLRATPRRGRTHPNSLALAGVESSSSSAIGVSDHGCCSIPAAIVWDLPPCGRSRPTPRPQRRDMPWGQSHAAPDCAITHRNRDTDRSGRWSGSTPQACSRSDVDERERDHQHRYHPSRSQKHSISTRLVVEPHVRPIDATTRLVSDIDPVCAAEPHGDKETGPSYG